MTAPSIEEMLTDTRIKLARIEGMLTQFISGNEQRLSRLEEVQIKHETRLHEKKGQIPEIKGAIKDLRNDVQSLEADRSGRQARNLALIAAIVGILGLALAVFNSFRFG